MPREIHLATPSPVSLEAIVLAAQPVDESLRVRALYDGTVIQLVDGEDQAVLSLENSRLLAGPGDLVRVSPQLAVPTADQLWWTEACAPWGPEGDPGVAVVRRLAELLRGSIRVEDGR